MSKILHDEADEIFSKTAELNIQKKWFDHTAITHYSYMLQLQRNPGCHISCESITFSRYDK